MIGEVVDALQQISILYDFALYIPIAIWTQLHASAPSHLRNYSTCQPAFSAF
jgi:hypothetical protein